MPEPRDRRTPRPARPAPRRCRRLAVVAMLSSAVAVSGSLGCSSPNRGRWRGTFEGGVSGDMEFTVNTRGTRAKGSITGSTDRGQKFEASFAGSLNQGFLNADFEGSSQTGLGLPAGFRGNLQGTLEEGTGDGSWTVDLIQAPAHYEGRWSALQTP